MSKSKDSDEDERVKEVLLARGSGTGATELYKDKKLITNTNDCDYDEYGKPMKSLKEPHLKRFTLSRDIQALSWINTTVERQEILKGTDDYWWCRATVMFVAMAQLTIQVSQCNHLLFFSFGGQKQSNFILFVLRLMCIELFWHHIKNDRKEIELKLDILCKWDNPNGYHSRIVLSVLWQQTLLQFNFLFCPLIIFSQTGPVATLLFQTCCGIVVTIDNKLCEFHFISVRQKLAHMSDEDRGNPVKNFDRSKLKYESMEIIQTKIEKGDKKSLLDKFALFYKKLFDIIFMILKVVICQVMTFLLMVNYYTCGTDYTAQLIEKTLGEYDAYCSFMTEK